MADPSQMTDEQLMATIATQQHSAQGTPPTEPSHMSDQELMATIAAQQHGSAAPTTQAQPPQQAGGIGQRLLQGAKNLIIPQAFQNPTVQQGTQGVVSSVVGEPGSHGESLGMVAGGILGAAGGPIGEGVGALTGGVLGAAGDYYLNPKTGESLYEHLKGAAGRSTIATVLGQTVGKAVGGLTKALVGPGAAQEIPAVAARNQSFKDIGMTSVPPSAVLGKEGGGYKAGLQEAAMGDNLYGAGPKREMIENVSNEAKAALQKVLEQRFPGISNDYAAIGVGLEASQEAMKEGMRSKVTTAFQEPAKTFARQQGIKAADVVFDRMGSLMDEGLIRVPTTNILDAVAALKRLSSTDSGFNRAVNSIPDEVFEPGAVKIGSQLPPNFEKLAPQAQRSILEQLTGQSLPKTSGEPPPGLTSKQLRAWYQNQTPQAPTTLEEIFTQMGLDPTAKDLSYDQMRHLMTSNLADSHTSTNPRYKVAAFQIGNAARQDLYALTANNPQMAEALNAAHELYQNEFLDVFVRSKESQIIEKKDYSQIVETFINPSTSIEGLGRIEKLVGPKGAQDIFAMSQVKLLKDSIVKGTEDQTSIPAYLNQVTKYKTPILQKIWGGEYGQWKEVVDRMRDVNNVYQASLNSSGTARQMGSYGSLIGTGKLAVFAGLGLFGAHAGIPLNPLVSAALGVAMPFGLSKLWFSPKMLKYWVEGMNWSPTMKNAGAVANRLTTRIGATLAVEAANQQPNVVKIQNNAPQNQSGVQIVR